MTRKRFRSWQGLLYLITILIWPLIIWPSHIFWPIRATVTLIFTTIRLILTIIRPAGVYQVVAVGAATKQWRDNLVRLLGDCTYIASLPENKKTHLVKYDSHVHLMTQRLIGRALYLSLHTKIPGLWRSPKCSVQHAPADVTCFDAFELAKLAQCRVVQPQRTVCAYQYIHTHDMMIVHACTCRLDISIACQHTHVHVHTSHYSPYIATDVKGRVCVLSSLCS